jgi:hypothetical protein
VLLRLAALRQRGRALVARSGEQTVLYGIVSEHLETFIDEARAENERGLPPT